MLFMSAIKSCDSLLNLFSTLQRVVLCAFCYRVRDACQICSAYEMDLHCARRILGCCEELHRQQIQSAISKLKAGKSPDGNGTRAEDIKACDDETRVMVRQIFNVIIKRNNFTPDEWKKVRIKVIHKKGDVENVSNYRPICSLPAMYKLFSTILYGRLYPMLGQKQAEDQAQRTTLQHTD